MASSIGDCRTRGVSEGVRGREASCLVGEDDSREVRQDLSRSNEIRRVRQYAVRTDEARRRCVRSGDGGDGQGGCLGC
ncbi:hypothetical protein L484_019290 [Morus notabilis]|uniref:Uncharacterized protein n=1 Tax=Morus notabilis TaxID=981085 RepID=W9RRV5_9ROSA|nr:hypothetical protein L484_019290 [Morus notabilis]